MVGGSFNRTVDLPQVIPVFPLDGALLLPRAQLPLNIFEPRYLNMIDDAMASERFIGMIQTRDGGTRQNPRLARVGCAGRITSFSETQDGRYLITLTGVCRFAVAAELGLQSPYRQVRTDYAEFAVDLADIDQADMAGRDELLAALKPYLEHHGMALDWGAADKAPTASLVSSLCMALPFEVPEKQALLEAPDLAARHVALVALLRIGGVAPLTDDGDDTPPRLQ